MSWPVNEALELWGMSEADCQLAATRENRVYRVTFVDRTFALRLHRPGLRSDSELRSELQWMAAISAGGLHVPTPIPATDGSDMHVERGIQIDVLTWLSGSTVSSTISELTIDDRVGLYRAIGREMARLHEISDAWTPPDNFARWSWDLGGLVGEAPIWDRFWDNPTLSQSERAHDARSARRSKGRAWGRLWSTGLWPDPRRPGR